MPNILYVNLVFMTMQTFLFDLGLSMTPECGTIDRHS